MAPCTTVAVALVLVTLLAVQALGLARVGSAQLPRRRASAHSAWNANSVTSTTLFGPRRTVVLGSPVHAAAAADIDGDGLEDVVAATEHGLVVLCAQPRHLDALTQPYLECSNGTGLRAAEHMQPMSGVGVADFNGDGLLDIVSTPRGGWQVRVFLQGRRSGGAGMLFEETGRAWGVWDAIGNRTDLPRYAQAGYAAHFEFRAAGVVVGDFNNDGRADVLVYDEGTEVVGASQQPTAVFVWQLNNDGGSHLVRAAAFADALPTDSTTDNARLVMRLRFSQVTTVTAVDVNGDGRSDVVTTRRQQPPSVVLAGSSGVLEFSESYVVLQCGAGP